MKSLILRRWMLALGVVVVILSVVALLLTSPVVHEPRGKLRSRGKKSWKGLRLKDRIALHLNYELDKRLAGLAIGLYRLTGGRIAELWKVNVLILTTRGRKSGKTRTTVLQYFPVGADMVVAAANSGRSSHPGWFYNLLASPTARVQVMDRTQTVYAEELSAEEAAAFWPHLLRVAPTYARYQEATSRAIPLVRLVPVLGSG
ncbi:MAG: nitroreductase/quinone reductase family protein [Ktedonobacterales bacterium]